MAEGGGTAWKKSGNRTLIITSEKISYPGGMSGKYTLDIRKDPEAAVCAGA